MAEDFSISVKKWVDKAKANADAVFQGIAVEALNTIKEKTPVKTGALKAAWQASVNGEVAPQDGAAPDSATAIASAVIGDKIFIFNPMKYAARVNFGFHGKDSLGRLYNQKGAHMLEQTLAELPQIAKTVLARFSK